MVCKRCGFPLGPKEVYCTKCGFNNMLEYKGDKTKKKYDEINYNKTATEEKEMYKNTYSGVTFFLILAIAFTLLIWLATFIEPVRNFHPFITTFVKPLTKNILFILTGIAIIESIVSYRRPDDNFFVSLFKYSMVLLVLILLSLIYTFLNTEVFSFSFTKWLPFLRSGLLLGLTYYLSKWLTWKVMDHWKVHHYMIYFVFYYSMRIGFWLTLIFLTNTFLTIIK
ncbi:MAG: hypothetical protein PHN72_03325 [Bacilli bacterium]|nr:hypothetical protein [Bacilli bacterium]